LLPEDVCGEVKLKNVREQTEDQDADEGAGETTSAAHQACAAYHNRGDCIEFESGAGIGLALSVLLPARP
jgi:hypothetical protein